MHIMHIALGGCLGPPPVPYGLTEDTGGHIAYVLGAATAQARRADVGRVDIVTRAFDAPQLGARYGVAVEHVAPGCTIRRLRTARSGYLDKAALVAEIPALRRAFLAALTAAPRRPDVIHAHFSDAAALAEAAAETFGIPWVYSSHSLGLEKAGAGATGAETGRIARERRAIARASAILASSRDEAERQIAAYDADAEGRVHRASPGVTAPRAAETAPARRLIAPFLRAPDKPVILAIARPIAKKNLAGLVAAYGGAPDLQRAANLVILAGLREGLRGAGAEADRVLADLFDAVDRHDLWGRVALPRRHGADDVAALYALAARGGVFANPARHEPFGLTLVEAAQANVPLVATRNGGPADIVATLGAGELVDPSDPASIADGLRRALSRPDRRARARAAGRRARRRHDWGAWAERAQSVYRGLAAPAPRCRAAHTLLVCDIDGTLTGDPEAAARFRAWHAARDGGVLFAVATGRSVSDARAVLAAWSLPVPDLFITSVGSEIWRPAAGGALTPCAAYAAHAGAGWDRARVAAALAPLGLVAQADYEQRRWKLSCLGTARDARRIGTALRAAGVAACVVHSHGRFIDVLPPGAGKAAAVRFEAARRGLEADACIVAGDSGNDLDMLRAFPRAIVPANGAFETAAARTAYRSPLPHAAGVLDGLARFGLAGAHGRPDLVAE